MIVFAVLLFLFMFFGLRYLKTFHIEGLSEWTMPIAFSLKVGLALFFVVLYTVILGNGELSEDAGVFMRESKMLRDVFAQSPSAYLKLLSGVGENQALIEQYLPETTHWDIGTQSIINDNKNILRIHSLIQFISFNNVIIHAIFFCFIALIGIKQLFLAVRSMISLKDNFIFWGIFLLPSLFFWTSSILKEPVMILGLGLLLRAFFEQIPGRKQWIFGVAGSLILLGFKPYVFIAVIPMIVFFMLTKVLPKRKIIGGLTLLFVLGVVIFAAFPGQRDTTIKTISRKQFDFMNVARGGVHAYADSLFYYFEPAQVTSLNIKDDSVWLKHDVDAQILQLGQIDPPQPVHLKADGTKWFLYFENERSNGYIPLTRINNSYRQLFLNIPEALTNALLRPFPNDPGSKLKHLAFLETLLVFGALIYAIFRRRNLTEKERIQIIGLIVFIVALSLFIGWTTPVVGAIARYRIPAYLSLLIIAGILIRPKIKTNE